MRARLAALFRPILSRLRRVTETPPSAPDAALAAMRERLRARYPDAPDVWLEIAAQAELVGVAPSSVAVADEITTPGREAAEEALPPAAPPMPAVWRADAAGDRDAPIAPRFVLRAVEPLRLERPGPDRPQAPKAASRPVWAAREADRNSAVVFPPPQVERPDVAPAFISADPARRVEANRVPAPREGPSVAAPRGPNAAREPSEPVRSQPDRPADVAHMASTRRPPGFRDGPARDAQRSDDPWNLPNSVIEPVAPASQEPRNAGARALGLFPPLPAAGAPPKRLPPPPVAASGRRPGPNVGASVPSAVRHPVTWLDAPSGDAWPSLPAGMPAEEPAECTMARAMSLSLLQERL